MKTKRFIISIFILLMSNFGMSQTTGITFYMAGPSDSANNIYCGAPSTVPFWVYGSAVNYLPTDVVQLQVSFGDGTDTAFTAPIIQNSYFYEQFNHTYSFPGHYSLQYIATGPDGDADTIIAYNSILVSDTCGNASGYVYIDADGDCIFDAGELPLSGIQVNASLSGQIIGTYYTNQNGFYSLNLGFGNTYEISVGTNVSTSGYSVECPVSGNYQVSTFPSTGNNFALSCTSGFDLVGNINAWGFRPGFVGYIYPTIYNNYCLPTSGQYKIVLDPLLTYVGASIAPDQISGDTLIFNFSNINNSFYYSYLQNSISVTTSTAAVLGDSICLQIIVEPIVGDAVPSNNTIYQCFEIRNSWDPNEKEVSPAGEGPLGNIAPNTTLNYTVHFQNTGTAEAYNIFVMDTIDSNLDISTFDVTAYSHPMTISMLGNNVVKFNFDNIMLPDSNTNEPMSHGFVSYQIHTKSGLVDGTEITNTAGIFFDFNPAVITNTTLNTISTIMGVEDLSGKPGSPLQLFPVPADKFVYINVPNYTKIDRLVIVNSLGSVVFSKTNIPTNTFTMNTSSFKPGVYLVKVLCGTVVSTANMIVKH